jgi:hypothetical protein
MAKLRSSLFFSRGRAAITASASDAVPMAITSEAPTDLPAGSGSQGATHGAASGVAAGVSGSAAHSSPLFYEDLIAGRPDTLG